MSENLWYCVDKNGFGWVFPVKPTRDVECGVWVCFKSNFEGSLQIKPEYLRNLFPKIRWEDEPVEININVTAVQ